MRSIAFPAISTGIYGFPKQRAAQIAVSQVVAALAKNAELAQVIFCCFDDETYRIYSELIAAE